MRKVIIFLIFLFLLSLFPSSAFAQENEVNLYLFWSRTCPHCTKEKAFLQKIVPEYPYLNIYDFEVGSRKNLETMKIVGEKMNADVGGVPLTIIGDYQIVGYLNDEITGGQIRSYIEELREKGDSDTVGKILTEENITPSTTILPSAKPTKVSEKNTVKSEANFGNKIPLPFFGNIDVENLSLPIITILIAAVDGFNPCAMWTLLFLINLLLGMKDRKRMWILGSTFIIASSFVYFLFLSAWLNLFLFLGFISWIRYLIGLFAIGAGIYYLREYKQNKEGSCKVTGGENRKKVFEKLKNITLKKQMFVAIIGIIILAFAVNLVELVCSAGLPAIYTKILSMANLPLWQYYLFLLLYILVFMLDDLFVFFVAMTTLRATGLQSKYSRYSHLIGGLGMLVIGLLMIFKPEWLSFS